MSGSLLALHANDAGITVLSDQGVVYREPGFALLDDHGLTTGEEAYRNARLKPRRIHSRFWGELSAEPLADTRFRHLTAADLVSLQLETLWKKSSHAGDRLIVAVPPTLSGDQLGLFLGIADSLDIPVIAMVDAAVAATRRQYPGRAPAHVDFGLHAAMVTRLGQNGQAQVERSTVVDDTGLVALTDIWIKTIANAFIQQSRFDPLHTAETEQLMQDSLPGWLAQITGAGSIDVTVEYRGIAHRATLERLELVSAAEPYYQRLVGQLRALFRADEAPAIQLTDRAARLPGLAETLATRTGGEVFLLEGGATGRGLLSRCREMQRSTGNVALLRQLHWDQGPANVEPSAAPGNDRRPTHLLFGAEAFEIGAAPLHLGSQPAEGQRHIELPPDMPGVSRQHCALRQLGSQCVVEDTSRYGTYLNGHRIDGSAVLQTGDQLRIGTPGHEFMLIVAEPAHAS